jgi:hypothetical protein
MSHEKDPAGLGPERPSTSVLTPGALAERLKRHLREWPRRYVEMRVGAVERRNGD